MAIYQILVKDDMFGGFSGKRYLKQAASCMEVLPYFGLSLHMAVGKVILQRPEAPGEICPRVPCLLLKSQGLVLFCFCFLN